MGGGVDSKKVQVTPPFTCTIQAWGTRGHAPCSASGRGFVRESRTPRPVNGGSTWQMTERARFDALKQGSRIAFPARQRHASGRKAALDEVQHVPCKVAPRTPQA